MQTRAKFFSHLILDHFPNYMNCNVIRKALHHLIIVLDKLLRLI